MNKTKKMAAAGLITALIVVMTVVPYTGYINYGGIEITTLHIPVIIAAALLGPWYGALLGGVWGVTCLARAFTNPLWIMFTNPLISVLPRILVGIVAGLIMGSLKKTRLKRTASASISAAGATLTNTVLVLGAIYIFGGMFTGYNAFFELFKTIIGTVIGLNGIIELIAAVLLVPLIYNAVLRDKSTTK